MRHRLLTASSQKLDEYVFSSVASDVLLTKRSSVTVAAVLIREA